MESSRFSLACLAATVALLLVGCGGAEVLDSSSGRTTLGEKEDGVLTWGETSSGIRLTLYGTSAGTFLVEGAGLTPYAFGQRGTGVPILAEDGAVLDGPILNEYAVHANGAGVNYSLPSEAGVTFSQPKAIGVGREVFGVYTTGSESGVWIAKDGALLRKVSIPGATVQGIQAIGPQSFLASQQISGGYVQYIYQSGSFSAVPHSASGFFASSIDKDGLLFGTAGPTGAKVPAYVTASGQLVLLDAGTQPPGSAYSGPTHAMGMLENGILVGYTFNNPTVWINGEPKRLHDFASPRGATINRISAIGRDYVSVQYHDGSSGRSGVVRIFVRPLPALP